MESKPFDLSQDIPNLQSKVFLVTGGTSGLGKEAILALSPRQPSHIYFTGRNTKAAADVVTQAKNASNLPVTITFLECDHMSLASVEDAMKEFISKSRRLDVLFCNAGVMGTDPGLTKDGYEQQFGINQMAHALMIKMLLPTLHSTAQTTADVRIVFQSSVGFRWTPSGGIRFDELKTTQDYWFAGRWVRYGQSKLANVLYASELARRYPNLTAISVHPGVIFTDLWNVHWSLLNRVFVYLATLGQGISANEGARTPCWAMTTSKQSLANGAFYEKVGVVGSPSKDSSDTNLGEKLWEWTEHELEKYGKLSGEP
ncbi:short-chain alcohol dehydrogenase [Xanthoria parietina]